MAARCSVGEGGAGFAGLLLWHKLREAGFTDVRFCEKGGDVGGTWYWNRYPGVACDVESYSYLPLLEEMGYVPSMKFASGFEILEYCQSMAERFGFYERCLFHTTVERTVWDESDARWTVHTDRGDAMRARFVVLANGILTSPKLARIDGMTTFRGESFHTSRWNYEVELRDRVVGIIGTGATAVQVIPELAKVVKDLYVFQRTPSTVDVRDQRATTDDERATIEKIGGDKPDGVNWKVDLSGGIQRVAIKHGCAPYGNAKARTIVWQFPDPVPVHREPLYTTRRDLVADYPTYADKRMHRVPVLFESIQKNDYSKDFPIIMTSGRLVEYEGGGDETRSNPWLAELQQDMFVEVNTVDANDLGVRDGEMVWVHSPEGAKVKVMAMVTERVGKGVVFMPFHFGGWYQGEDLRSKYPDGADPYVLGEAANTAFTYGYDSVTQMQESKVSMCRIEKA